MVYYTAVAEVSETIVELLRTRIAERSDVVNIDRREVALASPSDVSDESDVRLSLFLYRVTEYTAMNDRRRHVGDDQVKDPPLTLTLNYMLTAHPSTGGSDQTANTIDQHRVLGLGMQVLHDHSALDDHLPGSFPDLDVTVNISQEPADAMMNLWGSLQDTSVHPSATYRVAPVVIDSNNRREVPRVRDRQGGVERRPAADDTD